jgi:hypothetical protein
LACFSEKKKQVNKSARQAILKTGLKSHIAC